MHMEKSRGTSRGIKSNWSWKIIGFIVKQMVAYQKPLKSRPAQRFLIRAAFLSLTGDRFGDGFGDRRLGGDLRPRGTAEQARAFRCSSFLADRDLSGL